jgi:nitrogen fixation/metabolism regulation signal transduction histidine kinase
VVQKGINLMGLIFMKVIGMINGIVRKRYLGKQIVKIKKKFSYGFLFVLVVLLFLVLVFSLVNDSY